MYEVVHGLSAIPFQDLFELESSGRTSGQWTFSKIAGGIKMPSRPQIVLFLRESGKLVE